MTPSPRCLTEATIITSTTQGKQETQPHVGLDTSIIPLSQQDINYSGLYCLPPIQPSSHILALDKVCSVWFLHRLIYSPRRGRGERLPNVTDAFNSNNDLHHAKLDTRDTLFFLDDIWMCNSYQVILKSLLRS